MITVLFNRTDRLSCINFHGIITFIIIIFYYVQAVAGGGVGGGRGVFGARVRFSKRLDFGRLILKMHRMSGGSKY